MASHAITEALLDLAVRGNLLYVTGEHKKALQACPTPFSVVLMI